MEGPGGILRDSDVVEMLDRFDLVEVFTDHEEEKEYADLQLELTGYNANPTYLVLDSRDRLEVARDTFTNSKQHFLEFLRKGLTDRPAFRTQVHQDGLVIEVAGEEIEVLRPKGPLVADLGEPERYLGEEVRVHRGRFSGSREFRVGKHLEPGTYTLTVRLVSGLYDGDQRLRTVSEPQKLRFEVLPAR
jgi:hypothetical protein